MVDGIYRRSMVTTAATNGTRDQQQRKKQRAATSIAQHLEGLRIATSSDAVRDALADMAMRLIDPEDRDDFEGFDGPTVILDHLSRMTEEQATLNYAWKASTIYGSTWEAYEVHESLVLTVVIICHSSMEESIALQCLELGATRLLWELYATLPTSMLHDLQPILLSALRNLSYVEPVIPNLFPLELVEECWHLLTASISSTELQVLGAELLTNMASHDISLVSPDRERLASLVHQIFSHETTESYKRIAVLDLLTNLAVDATLCLLVMYELDDRKPHRYRHHSGAVYFLDLTECQRGAAVRQSMEALAHNLSWSDPTGKRKIQKLGLSSFMAQFALEPAINN